jgi:hypothetical protein
LPPRAPGKLLSNSKATLQKNKPFFINLDNSYENRDNKKYHREEQIKYLNENKK